MDIVKEFKRLIKADRDHPRPGSVIFHIDTLEDDLKSGGTDSAQVLEELVADAAMYRSQLLVFFEADRLFGEATANKLEIPFAVVPEPTDEIDFSGLAPVLAKISKDADQLQKNLPVRAVSMLM